MKSLSSWLRARLEASSQANAKKPLLEAFHFAWIATVLFCTLPLIISLVQTFLYGPGTILHYRIEDAENAFVSACITSAFTCGYIFLFAAFVLGIGLNSPATRRWILLLGTFGLPVVGLGLVVAYFYIFTSGYTELVFVTPIFNAAAYVGLAVSVVALVFAGSGWIRHFRARRTE
jgi:ABC-type Fe3+ transport system permease subunit